MTERLKEISAQAKQYSRTYVESCKIHGYYMESNEYDLRFEAKFAELIIRECMMVVEGFELTQEVALDEYMEYEASAVLKMHFEVNDD